MKRFMKKLFLVLAVAIMAVACSMDGDERNDFVLAFILVERVEMPDYVVPGNTYPVNMYFRRPTDCYYVQPEPYYSIFGDTRTVAVQALVIEDSDCQPVEATRPDDVKTFNFQCPLTTAQSFTFKFYKGNDAQGNQQFIEVVVPVQQ